MKNSRGFTVLEIAIVLVITGILSAFAFVKYRNTVATNELDKAANNLYMELRGLRARSFKYDDEIKATFNPTATPPRVTIEVWASDDAIPAYKTIAVHKITPPVKMGVPTDVSPTQPYSDWWWNNYAGSIINGVQGTWKTALTVTPDSRGEYSHGGVYLCHPDLKKSVYFIGITSAMQSIEFYKWENTKWVKL